MAVWDLFGSLAEELQQAATEQLDNREIETTYDGLPENARNKSTFTGRLRKVLSRKAPAQGIFHVPTSKDARARIEVIRLDFPQGFLDFEATMDRLEWNASIQLGDYNFNVATLSDGIIQPEEWDIYCTGKSLIEIKVLIIAPVALSKVKEARGLEILTGSKFTQYTFVDFAELPYSPQSAAHPSVRHVCATQQDILAQAGRELATRCCSEDPNSVRSEMSKRELIGSVVYASKALAGDFGIAPDFPVHSRETAGNVDYAILLSKIKFIVLLIEGKLSDLLEAHLGQVFATMHAGRRSDEAAQFGKRKRGTIPLSEVPMRAALTNGSSYIFFKYTASKDTHVTRSPKYLVQLKQGIVPGEAANQAKSVILRMAQMIRDGRADHNAFWEYRRHVRQ